jgi:hypothetical protein
MDLSREYQAIIAYVVCSQLIKGAEYMAVAAELKKHAAGSVSAIARLTGLSRNTIRRVPRGDHDLKRQAAPRGSLLDCFKDYLRQRRAGNATGAEIPDPVGRAVANLLLFKRRTAVVTPKSGTAVSLCSSRIP